MHGFVHETLWDRLRWGRRRGSETISRHRSAEASSVTRDGPGRRDRRRMAHNPEVAGSNPAPATKARGPFSNRERSFCVRFANGFANEAWPHGASPGRRPPSRRSLR